MVCIHKKYVINLSVIQILLKVGWKTQNWEGAQSDFLISGRNESI